MSFDWLVVGRRAVVCKAWRWLPGMKVSIVDESGVEHGWFRLEEPRRRPSDDWKTGVPDFRDAGSCGVLVHLAREVSGFEKAWAVYRDDDARWHVFWSGATHGGELGAGPTEVEAWINVIENQGSP